MNPLNEVAFFADENYLAQLIKHFGHGDSALIANIIKFSSMSSNDELRWQLPGWDENYKVVQFWDTTDVPADVMSSVNSNKKLFPEETHVLYNMDSASEFIEANYGSRVLSAFRKCHHPAMQSDFFRLAYLYLHGGLYIDADMEFIGGFGNSTFQSKNFLYISSAIRHHDQNPDGSWRWLTQREFLSNNENHRIVCYFQNDIIACTPFSEIIRHCLVRAVRLIEQAGPGERLRAHTVSGPTNLTVSVLTHIFQCGVLGQRPARIVVFDRDLVAKGGRYEYKLDQRNWQIAEA